MLRSLRTHYVDLILPAHEKDLPEARVDGGWVGAAAARERRDSIIIWSNRLSPRQLTVSSPD
jgi:hypothetical protein